MSGEYGGWGRTSHVSVSKYVLTGLATWGWALSCCKITLSCLCSFCGRLSFNARLNRINCSRYRSHVMAAYSTLHSADPTKYRAWASIRGYSVLVLMLMVCRADPMIFYAWDYCPVPTFHRQWQYDAENLTDFAVGGFISKKSPFHVSWL